MCSNQQPAISDQQGFTLIELSIVLVIIGLLVGGVLVGQSMIESAKINKEVRRLSQWSIAIAQFADKFKQEAGDTILFSNPGDNDGDTWDQVGACPTKTFEFLTAWSHLTQSGMLAGEKYIWPNPALGCPGGPSVGAGYVGVVPTIKNTADGYLRTYNYGYSKLGTDFGGTKYQRYIDTSYDPEILWGIESKLDDGLPSQTTGKIRAYTPIGVYTCDQAGVEQEAAAHGAGTRSCETAIFFNESLN